MKMKRIPATECPKCGCTIIGRGYHLKNGAIIPYGGLFKSSAVLYEICTNCGYIIAGYVDEPEMFYIDQKRIKKDQEKAKKQKTFF